MKALFENISNALFSELIAQETLAINLIAEKTEFVRFNAGKVRQNTFVNQIYLHLEMQTTQGVCARSGITLTGDFASDKSRALHALEVLRQDIAHLPVDPYMVALTNAGSSSEVHEGVLPSLHEVVEAIHEFSAGVDLAGIWCAGDIYRGNANSLGQTHWYETRSFFFDWSLYTVDQKAVKAMYAGRKWNPEELKSKMEMAKFQLGIMNRPKIKVQKGGHRAYLAPAAVTEFVEIMGWGGFGLQASRSGEGALRDLELGVKQLSPMVNWAENLALGVSPRFNSFGEVGPSYLPLVEQGKFKNFLISTRSAKQYGGISNFAESSEAPRSFEMVGGNLKTSEILSQIGTGLWLSNLHYLNWSDRNGARITGMSRYACLWVENGELVGPIEDLRFDDSIYNLFGSQLLELTTERELNISTMTYDQRALGGSLVPGALVESMAFTL